MELDGLAVRSSGVYDGGSIKIRRIIRIRRIGHTGVKLYAHPTRFRFCCGDLNR